MTIYSCDMYYLANTGFPMGIGLALSLYLSLSCKLQHTWPWAPPWASFPSRSFGFGIFAFTWERRHAACIIRGPHSMPWSSSCKIRCRTSFSRSFLNLKCWFYCQSFWIKIKIQKTTEEAFVMETSLRPLSRAPPRWWSPAPNWPCFMSSVVVTIFNDCIARGERDPNDTRIVMQFYWGIYILMHNAGKYIKANMNMFQGNTCTEPSVLLTSRIAFSFFFEFAGSWTHLAGCIRWGMEMKSYEIDKKETSGKWNEKSHLPR